MDNAFPFALPHRSQGGNQTAERIVLYFHKDQESPFLPHQVDLPLLGVEVAVHDLIAALGEPFFGDLLPLYPQLAAFYPHSSKLLSKVVAAFCLLSPVSCCQSIYKP